MAARAAACVEPDAAGAPVATAGAADADVLEPVEEGAAEVRRRGLTVPPSAPNVPGVRRDEQRSRGTRYGDPWSRPSMAAPLTA